ncbi:MAG: hypothetical protein Q9222_000298 [Ikaeria aurantiellina]
MEMPVQDRHKPRLRGHQNPKDLLLHLPQHQEYLSNETNGAGGGIPPFGQGKLAKVNGAVPQDNEHHGVLPSQTSQQKDNSIPPEVAQKQQFLQTSIARQQKLIDLWHETGTVTHRRRRIDILQLMTQSQGSMRKFLDEQLESRHQMMDDREISAQVSHNSHQELSQLFVSTRATFEACFAGDDQETHGAGGGALSNGDGAGTNTDNADGIITGYLDNNDFDHVNGTGGVNGNGMFDSNDT